jgi:Loader and inhibitor of phage G40P
MTPQEWLRVCSRISKVWPHQPVPPPTVDAWYQLLADLDGDQVAVAVDAIALDGAEFPPQAGRIRRKVVELSDAAQLWGEAWHEVQEAVWRYGSYHNPGEIPWSTEDVRELVRLKGWEYLCTTTDPGSVVEAQCRDLWETIRARRRDDASYAILPPAGLRRLVGRAPRPSEPRRPALVPIGRVLP